MQVLDPEQYARGHDIAEWMELGQDDYHRAFINRVAGMIELAPEDEQFFGNLPTTARLVIISDACGSDSEALGVVKRVEQACNGKLEVRVFGKREAPDLMQRYLYKGKYETVPVFIAVDDQLQETRVMTELAPGHFERVKAIQDGVKAEYGLPEEASLDDLHEGEQWYWIGKYRAHFRSNKDQIFRDWLDEMRRLIESSIEAQRVPVRTATSATRSTSPLS